VADRRTPKRFARKEAMQTHQHSRGGDGAQPGAVAQTDPQIARY